MNTRRKGFILLPVVLATFIMGMLGIGLASMYSGTFSTMNAGKAASKAKDFATIEGNYIKLNGYDTAASMTHDWESLSDLVGPDGSEWQSKVENSSTSTTADGDQVKVMKVAVKKNSDIASRYTYEVPVVNGNDTYTKAEIDAMMSVVNGNFTKVNNRIDELANKSDNIQSQIDGLKVDISTLNTNLSKLNTLVENYRTSLLNSINQEIADRKAADSAESSARIAADNKLNQRCDAINKSIQDLQNSLNTTNERLNSEIQARKDADAAIRRDMTSIQNELTTKYTNLQSTVSQLSDKVTNMGSKVDTNTNKIASINELLKNSFVFNGKRDTGISLAYDATSKSMKAYYNGQEVALGTQSGIDDSPTPDKFTDEGGYYKFPNGLVMQWGKIKRDDSTGHINFSIKFPHKLLYVSTQSSAITIRAVSNTIYNRTLTGFDYIVDTTTGGGDPNGTGWFAIGY